MVHVDTRPDWDAYGLLFAQAAATRADCTRRQVGAAIFDAEHRVVSAGYNGAPSGKPGCLSAGACPRGLSDVPGIVTSYDSGAGLCIALHAEQNAVARARWEDMRGGTVYITCEPCVGCIRTLQGTPLARAVWPGGELEL